MLIVYDPKRGVWIASATIDGNTVHAVSRNMKHAMQTLGLLMRAPASADIVCGGGYVGDCVVSRPITIQ